MAYQYPQSGQASLHPQYQQQQAAQQLPHGWEAKYDANYRRYYFINHFTKETTWNDPRTAPSPNQQHQQAQSSGVPAPPRPMPSPAQAASTPQQRQTPAQVAPKHQENIPLQSMAARNTQQHTTETSFTQASSSGKSEQEKLRVKNKIKADYDLADIILEAALEAADYNEPRIRELLETMGYDPKKGKKGGKKTNAKAAAPKGNKAGPSRPPRTESPAHQLEDEKPTDFSALYKTQPDMSEEDKASEESVNMSSAASLRSSESTTRAVSRSDVHVTVASSLSGLMHSRASDAASPIKSADNAHLKSLMHEQPAARKKQHTNKSTAKILLSRDIASKVSVGQASGPDFSLWKGPDSSALQADMMPLRGPDPSLRHGPRREHLSSNRVERMQRCCLAVGPDRSLHSGANASLLMSFREAAYV